MNRTDELVHVAVIGLLKRQAFLPIGYLLHKTAGRLGVTKPQMIKALDAMEEAGLIVRRVVFAWHGPEIRVYLAGEVKP